MGLQTHFGGLAGLDTCSVQHSKRPYRDVQTLRPKSLSMADARRLNIGKELLPQPEEWRNEVGQTIRVRHHLLDRWGSIEALGQMD